MTGAGEYHRGPHLWWPLLAIAVTVSGLVGCNATRADPKYDVREIAYSSKQGDRYAIWIIDEFGEYAREITPDFTAAADPSFSPDGQVLYFASNDTGDFEIYATDMETGTTTRLTFDPGDDRAPSASPDGRTITFLSNREGPSPDVWIMDVDGTAVRRVTAWEGHKVRPSFSPDGATIAVQADTPQKQIYLVRPDGTQARNISDNEFGDRYPAWSPDGRELAFTSVRNVTPDGESDEVREIYLMSVDGSGQRPLVGDGVDSRHAHWSPDGGYIAFDRATPSSRHIFIVRPDGSGLRQVTTTGRNAKPSFRPTTSPVGFAP